MYAGVPNIVPINVSVSVGLMGIVGRLASSSDGFAIGIGSGGSISPSTFASPQSMTLTTPNAPTMMFAGLRSR